ncbi:helix-turn-helix domain-containing protein [Nesterenkonia jeotgali]|uniref:Excisionase family DNA binding protein n=1 Tax=Nesterenkonia jeotgali TaxID=317018 RepID=A0A839FP34_9MICC|nr:helix-turn-helix domain-containing protein [Nesterenkonia jeotgali]MBA8920411.1 excisionase family DNA binding protein [Nesterenkonia jeotgali]
MTHDDGTPALDKAKLSCSVAEASAATGVSQEQLRKIIRSGNLAAVSPPGFSRLLIRAADLQDWLDAGE